MKHSQQRLVLKPPVREVVKFGWLVAWIAQKWIHSFK